MNVRRSVDAIIFDLDGTLVDSLADLTAAVNHVRAIRGAGEFAESAVRAFVGDGLELLLSRALGTSDKTVLKAAAGDFHEYYAPHCLDRTRLYDGAIDALDRYAAKKLAVVSNKPETFTRKILEGLGVDSRFQIILGPESVRNKKPDPESYILVASRFGVDPARFCAVGDRSTDIEAGKSAGMMTVGVTYGIGDPDEMRASGPDAVIANIRELENLIE